MDETLGGFELERELMLGLLQFSTRYRSAFLSLDYFIAP